MSSLLNIFNINQVFIIIFFIALLVWISFISERKPKRKVFFFGDSITQQGAEPNGYISILEGMLQDESIKGFSLIGSGIGGNTIDDLLSRIGKDVLSAKPETVIVFAGVNDAWRIRFTGTYTDEALFEKTYRKIVDRLMKNEIRVVLCTVGVIGEKKNNANELDHVLDAYSNIITNIAVENNLSLIDLRNAFKKYEHEHNKADYDKGILTTDAVHLNFAGNELVAGLMLEMLKQT